MKRAVFKAWLGAVAARGWGSPAARRATLARGLALLCVLLPPLWVLAPWLARWDTYGFHDWDVMTAHRQLAIESLRSYGELPAWNPYACGGFPAWGYIEAATNVVSPWLPFYWLLDIRSAIRIEVLGMALIGATGTYLAAGTLTTSRAGRAAAVVVFACNGRFGLQTASGHAWHLAYALLPWAFYSFERARARGASVHWLGGLGVVFAMLVYSGGIYPLPHTVLCLSLWALLSTGVERSVRPIAVLSAGGALGVMLSAPKLLPMLSTFSRAPREIDSTEVLPLSALWPILTSRQQAFFDRPAPVRPYGWHEWGMYLSPIGVVLVILAFVLATGKKEQLLKLIAALFLLLGLGAFHRLSPWALLHELPLFRSQHVPSRFLYPAAFLCGLVLASWLGRWVERAQARAWWAEHAALACVLALGLDIASVAQKPMAQAMILKAPAIAKSPTFKFEERPPHQYLPRDWAAPLYLSMLANTGVIKCYGVPPFEELGALAARDRRYRGEVHVVGGGSAEISGWTPSRAEIQVRGAQRGARVIYNMNFDRGWSGTVDHEAGEAEVRVASFDHRVGLMVPEGDSVVRLRYQPPGLGGGVLLCVLGVAAWLGAARWQRHTAHAPRA